MTTINEKIEQLEGERERVYQKTQRRIAKEVEYIDVKPYSHNIISLALGQVSQELGSEYADELIEEFGLENFGWRKGG